MLRLSLASLPLLAIGCASATSSPSIPADSGLDVADGPQTDVAPADAGRCTESLDASLGWADQTCPAEAPASGARCPGSTASVETGNCGALRSVRYDFYTHSVLCVYASGRLVGLHAQDDVTSFCDQTSADVYAGDVPDGCTADTPAPGYCSADGGGD